MHETSLTGKVILIKKIIEKYLRERINYNYNLIRCNFPDISYLSETQKNNFQFLKE